MTRRLRARDVMTRPAITVHPEAPVPELSRIMARHHVSALPVTDHLGRLLGIVSETDLPPAAPEPTPFGRDRAHGATDLRTRIAGDIMQRDVLTAREDTPVRALASLMARNAINHVPITTERHVAGIVARADVLRIFSRSDEDVVGIVRRVLDDEEELPGYRLEAAVLDGVVHLRGEGGHPAHLELLEHRVLDIDGVLEVDLSEVRIRAEGPRILLVTDRRSVTDAVGAELERGGFDVLLCPGPRPPDYVCVAGTEGSCPLVHGADAVVLDRDLGSDAVHLGITSWQLLTHYRRAGLPVVALGRADEDLPRETPDPGFQVLPRTTDPRSVAGAVARALGKAAGPPTARRQQGQVRSSETP